MITTWLKKELNHWTGETAFLFTHFSLLCFMTAFLIWVLLSKESGSAQATLCRGLLLCFHSVDNDLLYWEDFHYCHLLRLLLLLPHSFPAITCHHGHWRCILHHLFQCCLLILTFFFILFNEMLKINFFILDSDELLGAVVLVFQYSRKFSSWNKNIRVQIWSKWKWWKITDFKAMVKNK